jgi:hypothetical protein
MSSEPSAKATLSALCRWMLKHSQFTGVNNETAFRNLVASRAPETISASSVRRYMHDDGVGVGLENVIKRTIDVMIAEFRPELDYSSIHVQTSHPTKVNDERIDDVYRGVWTLVQFRSIRDNENQFLPPTEYRTALIVYGNDVKNGTRRTLEIYGRSTLWQGHAYCRHNKIYLSARETNFGNEDLSIICFPVHEADKVPQHQGLLLGVGLSAVDSLIYSSRCLIRRNNELSSNIVETRRRLVDDNGFREAFCCYFTTSQLERSKKEVKSEKEQVQVDTFTLATAAQFREAARRPSKWIRGDRIILQL